MLSTAVKSCFKTIFLWNSRRGKTAHRRMVFLQAYCNHYRSIEMAMVRFLSYASHREILGYDLKNKVDAAMAFYVNQKYYRISISSGQQRASSNRHFLDNYRHFYGVRNSQGQGWYEMCATSCMQTRSCSTNLSLLSKTILYSKSFSAFAKSSPLEYLVYLLVHLKM